MRTMIPYRAPDVIAIDKSAWAWSLHLGLAHT